MAKLLSKSGEKEELPLSLLELSTLTEAIPNADSLSTCYNIGDPSWPSLCFRIIFRYLLKIDANFKTPQVHHEKLATLFIAAVVVIHVSWGGKCQRWHTLAQDPNSA